MIRDFPDALERAWCLEKDTRDPLAGFRDRFALPEGVIYLDGNSLGPLPKAAVARLSRAVEGEWGRDLIKSWNLHGWIDLPRRVGARIAPLIGAEPDEVIVADSTSVDLFKCAAAALRLKPEKRVILAEAGDFPTDLYILQGLSALLGDVELRMVAADEIEGALTSEVGLLVLTHVNYRTGQVHDMAGLCQRAREVGAFSLWDLSHSAGVLDVDLSAAGADFAVGCGYKFLNGGPGAPAYVFAARRLQAGFESPLTGWMGHARPFSFVDAYEPAQGMARALCGTPPILSLIGLEEGVASFDGVDMRAAREKAARLGDLFLSLVEARLSGRGFSVACPRDGGLRGGQVSLAHPHGYAICQALSERGVVGDFRAPDVVRFGLAPLFVRYADVWDAVERLALVMESGAWQDERFAARAAVT